MIVIVDVDVNGFVIDPVIVAVHLNGNAPVVVIDTVDVRGQGSGVGGQGSGARSLA